MSLRRAVLLALTFTGTVGHTVSGSSSFLLCADNPDAGEINRGAEAGNTPPVFTGERPSRRKPPHLSSDMPAGVTADSGFHGGLVVWVGLRDPAQAISLGEASNVLVHGLVQNNGVLTEIRDRLRSAGAYDRVSVMSWRGPMLPYADNMVNLLLVPDGNVRIDTTEIERVLASGGVARIQR